MASPQQVLDTMLAEDHFSRWIGIIIDEHGVGYCRLRFTVRQEMLNGFGIAHGGILFSVADSAFAFACNSRGLLSVALDANISFVKSAKAGDILTVEAKELHSGNKTGFYDVYITDAAGETIALFRGTAYNTGKPVCKE
jgi:acyl-CoA thioesterase